jgi:hypothetical protein
MYVGRMVSVESNCKSIVMYTYTNAGRSTCSHGWKIGNNGQKYKGMIDKITTLSGENDSNGDKKTDRDAQNLRGYYENDRSLRSYLSLISVICNSIPDVASTSVMSKWNAIVKM